MSTILEIPNEAPGTTPQEPPTEVPPNPGGPDVPTLPDPEPIDPQPDPIDPLPGDSPSTIDTPTPGGPEVPRNAGL